MTDIIKRLKAKPPKGFVTSPLMIEAADEIERLRKALEYFTCDCRGDNCKEPYHDCGRVARDALRKKK